MLERIFQISKSHSNDAEILKHNLIAHIFDGVLYQFGFAFISIQTVLPVFVQNAGGGAIAIGSVTVLWNLGVNLPQVLFLPLTHRAGPVKPVMLRYSLILRLFFFVMGLCALFVVGKVFVPFTVGIVLLLILLTAITASLATPPWFQLFAETAPVILRGRLLAIRQMFGSGLGIIAGSVVTLILAAVAPPLSFALLFFIAFALTMVSYYFLTRLKEPNVAIDSKSISPANFRKRGLAILREDKNFRNFLYADAMIWMGITATGFFAVYGLQKFNLPISGTGAFTAVTMASMAVSNMFFGYLGDRYGHKYNMICLSLSIAFSSIIAFAAQSVVEYWIVFFFMGCTLSLQGLSRLPLVAEMSGPKERPIYIALVNTITAPTIFIGILAGAAIKWAGYEIVFLCYGLLGFAGAWWLWKKVEEPRGAVKN